MLVNMRGKLVQALKSLAGYGEDLDLNLKSSGQRA